MVTSLFGTEFKFENEYGGVFPQMAHYLGCKLSLLACFSWWHVFIGGMSFLVACFPWGQIMQRVRIVWLA
jgi:hypothetical protein